MPRGRRKKRPDRASRGYTVGILVLVAVVVFLGLGLYGLFAPGASRAGVAKVLVLNGCGAEGVGQRTSRLLRGRGYDVVDFRNAEHFSYAETIVVDRTGDLESAAVLGRLLGISNVIQQVQETPLEDIVVVVGDDYGRFLREEDGP